MLCLALSLSLSPVLAQDGDSLWSFEPLRNDAAPSPTNAPQTRNPVDLHILQSLETRALEMSPPADRRTLLRRVTFDLTGLPPTPTEIEAFLNDDSPDAWERVVDRLLASPRHGERWGRHWLDLVRYADTSGNSDDFPVPTAWLYRNYVIDAFNADRPYDRFLAEQIAGDLQDAPTDFDRHRNIVATGYLAISRRFGVDEKEFHQTIEDTIINLGQAFLGLSIHCARCHDHKFDPVTQADYYALYGIFESTRYAFPGTEVFQSPKDFIPLVSDRQMDEVVKPFEARVKHQDVEIERLRQLTLTIPDGPERDRAVEQYNQAREDRVSLLKNAPGYLKAYAVSDSSPVNAKIHDKGNPLLLGEEVPRRFLTVFGAEPIRHPNQSSGRADLAEWLTSPTIRPLTARVMANRVWQHHFGRGIVPTENNFGTTGLSPTHPELLDFLARQLIEGGWSVKSLHRLILLSRTYQQASRPTHSAESHARSQEIDPDNEWLWRFDRRRLSAEEIRDSVLGFSGQLDPAMGAGHAFPPEYEWKFGQHTPYLGDLSSRHRSVYVMRQRLRKDPFLAVFDAADPNVATGRRSESTTPLQALWLMNNRELHELCRRFADRLLAEETEDARRLQTAYLWILGREPAADELETALGYCQQYAGDRRGAWASYLRVLLSSNEFLYVD
jgi:hypothetical protein